MANRKSNYCCDCTEKISKDETALCKKLLGIDIEEFYCINCLSLLLDCDRSDLEIKIQEFREQGCTLFL